MSTALENQHVQSLLHTDDSRQKGIWCQRCADLLEESGKHPDLQTWTAAANFHKETQPKKQKNIFWGKEVVFMGVRY